MIWSFLVAAVILTLMPGPDILFVLAVSIERGARQAFSLALGLCSGLVFHTTAVVLGLAVIIAHSPMLFTIIKYLGVSYLTYLGIMTIVSARKRELKKDKRPKIAGNDIETEEYTGKARSSASNERGTRLTNLQYYKRGVMMNILNPKVALFFLAFLPGFIDPASETPGLDTITLGAVFALQALVIFSLVSMLGSLAGRAMHIEKYTGSFWFAVVVASIYFALAVFIAL